MEPKAPWSDRLRAALDRPHRPPDLWLDTETYSEVPIKHGTYRYAEASETILLQYGWGMVGEPVVVDILAGEPVPGEILRAVADPECIVGGHNSTFDRINLWPTLGLHIPPGRWFDTMVQAYLHSLPGGLDKLSAILGLGDAAKDAEGKKLIQLFCKPLGKNRKLRRATNLTHPEEWAAFKEYARQDITATRAAYVKMPKWNLGGPEYVLWCLDQMVNDRGIPVDVALAERAVDMVKDRLDELKDEGQRFTAGAVESLTKRAPLLEFILAEYGIHLADLRRGNVERLLDDPDIPAPMRELLRMRLLATTSSTAKYRALLRAVNSDGRLRGTKQFCGAGRTGRWAGRVFQPDNLPRATLKQWEIDAGIELLLARGPAAVGAVWEPMQLASSAIRGVIKAPPGRKLVVSDLANIEGRGLAYLAGEEWKLQAFRDFDAGNGPDLYKLAYARSFSVDPASIGDDDRRQIGKVQELALGYEGGVGAFVTFALAYGIDLDDMAGKARATIPADVWQEAEDFADWLVSTKGRSLGLRRDTFVACDSLKRLWRRTHPATVNLWRDLADAFRKAWAEPGVPFTVGALMFQRSGAWLGIRLPSGRILCYPQVQLKEREITYMGLNQYTRKWERIHTHGGKLAENINQAFSRDVLAWSMPQAEDEGYAQVLSVHDELVTETLDTPEFTSERLSAILSSPKPWAPGLPLAAKGFEAYRYRK